MKNSKLGDSFERSHYESSPQPLKQTNDKNI